MSFSEPGHLGPGVAAQGQQVQDGRLSLGDRLPLLSSQETPHICRDKAGLLGSRKLFLRERGPGGTNCISQHPRHGCEERLSRALTVPAGGERGPGQVPVSAMGSLALALCCCNKMAADTFPRDALLKAA